MPMPRGTSRRAFRQWRHPALLHTALLLAASLVLAACTSGASASPSASSGSEAASASPASPTASPTAEPTPAGPDVAAGLALIREVDGVGQVFVIDPDGSARQVTGAGELASVGQVLPFWSPDRTMLAVRPRGIGSGTAPQLWVVNADGTEQRTLATVGENISWSADSTHLLYEDSVLTTDTTGEPARMWLLDVATGEATVIRRGNKPAYVPPDGLVMSFLPIVDGPQEEDDRPLAVVPLSGGEPREIARVGDAWWSPDGSALLLQEADGLYLAEPDGTNPRFVIDAGAPVWSPDGTRIAFSDNRADGTFVVGVVDTDGQVLWDDVPGVEATWSPDGTKLAIEVGVDELSIQVLDAASGGVILEIEGTDPSW